MDGFEELPDYDPDDSDCSETPPAALSTCRQAGSLPHGVTQTPVAVEVPAVAAPTAASQEVAQTPVAVEVPAVAAPTVAPQDLDKSEGLPADGDADGWLELLRDYYVRQLRVESQHPEPPPFNRALNFESRLGGTVPPGNYPRHGLYWQLDHLHETRSNGRWGWGPPGWGAYAGFSCPGGYGYGPYGPQSMQSHWGGGGRWNGRYGDLPKGRSSQMAAVMAAASPFLRNPAAAASLPQLLKEAEARQLSGAKKMRVDVNSVQVGSIRIKVGFRTCASSDEVGTIGQVTRPVDSGRSFLLSMMESTMVSIGPKNDWECKQQKCQHRSKNADKLHQSESNDCSLILYLPRFPRRLLPAGPAGINV